MSASPTKAQWAFRIILFPISIPWLLLDWWLGRVTARFEANLTPEQRRQWADRKFERSRKPSKGDTPVRYPPDNYRVYLESAHWAILRRVVLAEANGRCEKCGRTASQVHHNTYRRNIERAYRSDLVALCRHCHEREHGLR